MNSAEQTTDTTISAIDAAIAKAKERRANKEKGTSPKASKEERDASRKAAADKRAEERAARKAAKASTPKPTAHMTKVDKAGARLPNLGAVAQSTFDEAVRTLNSEQRTALALHLQHFNRVQATTRALSAADLKVGQLVRITGGDPKYIGMTGAVETLRRIRCFVTVPGVRKPVYLFVSDVEAVEGTGEQVIIADLEEEASATGTEG